MIPDSNTNKSKKTFLFDFDWTISDCHLHSEISRKIRDGNITSESLLNNSVQQNYVWSELLKLRNLKARGNTENINEEWCDFFEDLIKNGHEVTILTYNAYPFAIDLFLRDIIKLSPEYLSKITVIYGTASNQKSEHFQLAFDLTNHPFEPKDIYFIDDDLNIIDSAIHLNINCIPMGKEIPHPITKIKNQILLNSITDSLNPSDSTNGPRFIHFREKTTFYYSRNSDGSLTQVKIDTPPLYKKELQQSNFQVEQPRILKPIPTLLPKKSSLKLNNNNTAHIKVFIPKKVVWPESNELRQVRETAPVDSFVSSLTSQEEKIDTSALSNQDPQQSNFPQPQIKSLSSSHPKRSSLKPNNNKLFIPKKVAWQTTNELCEVREITPDNSPAPSFTSEEKNEAPELSTTKSISPVSLSSTSSESPPASNILTFKVGGIAATLTTILLGVFPPFNLSLAITILFAVAAGLIVGAAIGILFKSIYTKCSPTKEIDIDSAPLSITIISNNTTTSAAPYAENNHYGNLIATKVENSPNLPPIDPSPLNITLQK